MSPPKKMTPESQFVTFFENQPVFVSFINQFLFPESQVCLVCSLCWACCFQKSPSRTAAAFLMQGETRHFNGVTVKLHGRRETGRSSTPSGGRRNRFANQHRKI